MQQNATKLSPKWFSMVNSSPLGNASTPALRSVLKIPHAWSARGLRQKLFFSDESQWTITPDPIITLQPCYRSPTPSRPPWQTFKLLTICSINSLRFPLGQSKCFVDAIFKWYGQLQFVRLQGRTAVSYITGLVAGNPELPRPTGI